MRGRLPMRFLTNAQLGLGNLQKIDITCDSAIGTDDVVDRPVCGRGERFPVKVVKSGSEDVAGTLDDCL